MASNLADRIRMLRESVGMSQKELATRMGRTQSTISKWESGQREPSFEDLQSLYAIFKDKASEVDTSSTREAMGTFDVIVGGRDDTKYAGEIKMPRPRTPSAATRIPVFRVKQEGLDKPVLGDSPVDDMEVCGPLAAIRNAYAAECPDDQMEPALDPGDLAILDPNRAARKGDKVLVVTGDGGAFFAEFQGLTPYVPGQGDTRTASLRFLNPDHAFQIAASQIKTADVVAAVIKAR